MTKIGITGSIASGKSTFAKMISGKKYPLFSADLVVATLYKEQSFIKTITREFKLKNKSKIKDQIKLLVQKERNNFKKLEKIIHPLVRKKMKIFLKKKKRILILEIPLLIENKLMKYFDVIIFIGASKKKRMQRYISNKGTKNTFKLLENRQLKPNKKVIYANHVVNNIYSLKKLRESAKMIVKNYE
tara:strand:+ start:139 stop:699 length:561 start_codon:yes stop_codon:yes gene_type:complete